MDIRIENNNLENIIKKLEQDNLNAYNIVKDINSVLIKNLDSTRWSSSEKTKLDTTLIPFINNTNKYMLSYLNDCTNTLRRSSNLYQQVDSDMKDSIDVI